MPPLREPSARSPCAGCVTIWVDAQLSPALARWLSQQFSLVALSVQELGFRSAIDPETFFAAREANAIGSRKLHKVLHLRSPAAPRRGAVASGAVGCARAVPGGRWTAQLSTDPLCEPNRTAPWLCLIDMRHVTDYA